MRRLGESWYLNGWRMKAHDLRLIVAGDYSRIDEESVSQYDGWVPNDLKRKDLAQIYDVMVRNYEEGTSNKMLQAIKTLVLQVSYKFPAIEFDGVAPEEEEINALYCKARLGPAPRGTDIVHHMRLALLDYIISGLGWVWCSLDNGRPCAKWIDSTDVAYDLGAKLVTDIRWVAVRYIDTLGYWVDQFGQGPFKTIIEKSDSDGEIWRERRTELWFYFDTDDVEGTHAVIIGDTEGPKGDPILIEQNPHFMDVDGVRMSFLPLEPMYFMQLPSVRNPIGIAEMMLPAQMATRLSERYMRAVTERGAPHYDTEDGAYDKQELDKLQQGKLGEIIVRKKGFSPVVATAPIEIPKSILEWYNHNDQELTAHSGANPYATGNKVNGVKYASEVVAIQSTAGLTAGALAADHGGHYERVITKILWNAKAYDTNPLTLNYRGTRIYFGPQNPIGDYLRPDALPIVSEDSLQFQTKEKRIMLAAQNLQTAIQFKAATMTPYQPLGLAPSSLRLAYEAYLRATGEKNVDQWFEPDPSMMQMMPQPAPGGGGLPAGTEDGPNGAPPEQGKASQPQSGFAQTSPEQVAMAGVPGS